jgi:hypothetical protein
MLRLRRIEMHVFWMGLQGIVCEMRVAQRLGLHGQQAEKHEKNNQ